MFRKLFERSTATPRPPGARVAAGRRIQATIRALMHCLKPCHPSSVVLSVFLLLASVGPGNAQDPLRGIADLFMATVNVTLHHPPSLGLTVDTVAFARSTGECSEEFVNELIEDFVANGVDVVERERIEDMLKEIDLSASGLIDPDDAVSLGRILGPSALIFVDTTRCDVVPKRERKTVRSKEGYYYIYYATTEVHFKSSLRIVDLATGRIFTAKTVEKNPSQTARSTEGYPNYPSEYELRDAALHGAAVEVHRMFFPWTETRSLRYFKGKKCNLEAAYQKLRIGDVEGAAEQSAKNLEFCLSQSKIKPKTLSRAYYNVGMSHFMRNEYDKALENLEKAYQLKSGPRITETILECKRAKKVAADMRSYETRTAAKREDGDPSPFAGSSTPASEENASIAERLEQLKELHEQGILTQDEYEAKRKKILEEL